MKQITVRLEDEVHRAVKVRAASEGFAMEALGRAWFETYAIGGTVVASSPTVSERRSLPDHNVDPKDKAEQEHSRGRKKRSAMCEHRVPAGSFCKVCDV